MTEDKTKENAELTEKELEQAAGGTALGANCFFTYGAGDPWRDAWDRLWMRCGSNCGFGAFACSCHGKEYCVDKKHLVSEDLELLPGIAHNHRDKKRRNDYNTV